MSATSGHHVLFYSAWPLGYHNREAERKALAFAGAGYRVTYVAGIGTCNPRFSNLPKLADRLRRKLGPAQARQDGTELVELESAAVLVAPPRHVPLVARCNTAWLGRQLNAALANPEDTVAWVRWPTPELVEVLCRRKLAGVVYECVDAYWHTPGITGRWVDIHDQAERRLADLADFVVVPGEAMGDRFRSWGAQVRTVPHGVDLFPRQDRTPGLSRRPVVIGFVGTLDYKLEIPVLRHIALSHPEWRVRLVGPVQERFDPSSLSDLPNVRIEPAIAHQDLGATLAGFDAGIMPYFDHPMYHASVPLKNLELLAAGLPAVARPCRALLTYSDLLYFAETPEDFMRQLERALAEDTRERAHQRRVVAEANTWDRRMKELLDILEETFSLAAAD